MSTRLAVVGTLYLLASSSLAAQEATPKRDSVSAGADSLAARAKHGAQQIKGLRVVAPSTRGKGYAVKRSTTATRTDTPLRDTPQSATVLTRALIADQAMQSMADVVRYVPGITMAQGEGHRDAPVIRGNSSTADFYVDGVRDDAQYLRDIYNVERIEALKGSNAMVFGRGGGGGVINRVNKEAVWAPVGSLTLEGGSFDHKRLTADVGQGFGEHVAFRLNGMRENSAGFRNSMRLRRQGINPALTLLASATTHAHVDYEHFIDERRVDRGIPSFQGRPSGADIRTYFGDPDVSHSNIRVDGAGAVVEHAMGAVTLKNRTRYVQYDKFYQNVFPGAVNASGTQVSLSGYNNGTFRKNVFNQTDVTLDGQTGRVGHTLLVGAELGRQGTDNYRETGYFGGNATSTSVPFDQPTRSTGVAFRQSASDADSHVRTDVAALYAQDQITLSQHWQAIVGLRVDRFALRFHNNRNGQDLRRNDQLVSPRAGLIFKPIEPVSLYGSYSVSQLPSAGDQFSSLTVTTQTLEPERFANYELGAKWDVSPSLSLSSALFRLDRTKSQATDPNDPSRIVQTGGQRTTGYELGVAGNVTSAWEMAGGYSAQKAEVTSTTTAAKAGASVPLVPRQTLSLWNKYQVAPAAGVGLGVIHQARMYAAIDNTVALPAFTRVDGALFYGVTRNVRAQLNVENLLDTRYYATSQGNNNILPGAERTFRLSLTAGL